MSASTDKDMMAGRKRRDILAVLLCAAVLTACAATTGVPPSEAIDDEGPGATVTVIGPAGSGDGGGSDKAMRRVAGVAQGAVLLTRSVPVDPINRPVSNLLSLGSYATKSVTGLLRRTALNTVQFPLLEQQPIPPVANRDGMDLVRWEEDLDRISGQPRMQGDIRFLVGGEEYFTRLFEAFGEAGESIDIRTFIFDNDDYAVAVADYLKARSQDVDVRIQVDSFGNLLATQSDPESLPAAHEAPLSILNYLEAGSEIRIRSRSNPWLTGDHTKTTIIDREIAFVGGMNIGREYRYDWHDLMMEVSGPIVDRLADDSDKAWARAGIAGDAAQLFGFLSGRDTDSSGEGYEIRPLYTRDFDSQIYRAQLEAIRRSRSYILIENAYFSDDVVLYELAKARRRGVDVRVILPTTGNHGALNASNQVAINKMLENGIRVYLYPGMSHVKAAVYDGWACVGSANFDKLSLEVNKELNLGTSDAAIVDRLIERVFNPDLAKSAEVSERVEVTLQAHLIEVAVDELL